MLAVLSSCHAHDLGTCLEQLGILQIKQAGGHQMLLIAVLARSARPPSVRDGPYLSSLLAWR